MSLEYHGRSLTPAYIYDAQWRMFKDYGLCSRSKVVDYSEDLDSLALENSHLIWKSHMIAGGWDLCIWLPQSRDKDRLWRSSLFSFFVSAVKFWAVREPVGSSSVFVFGCSHQAIEQHMLHLHTLINLMRAQNINR